MKKILILIMGLTIFCGCKKVLELDPLANASENTYFKTAEDAKVGLNAVYATLPNDRDFWKDCSSDNSIMTNAWGEGGMGFINQGSQKASDAYLLEEYSTPYQSIRRALYYLTKLKAIDFDANLKKRYEAEARFALAMRYFRLVEHFGDVPLIKEQPVLLEESKIPRNEKQEVLAYALQCVNFSVDNLPVAYTDAGDNGRITKAAALMLRANIYLYLASWAKFHSGADVPVYWQHAANSADSVTTMGYRLEDDFAFVFTEAANNNNKEVILGRQYVKNLITHMLPVLASPGGVGVTGEGWASFCATRDLVDSYECTDGKNIQSSSLYNPANPYQNRDRRLAKTFILPGIPIKRPDGTMKPFQPDPSSGMPERIGAEGGGGKTGYMYLKFNDLNTLTPDRSNINWPIYRYSETLLIIAEAFNEFSPGNPKIKSAVDQVRQRAGLPLVEPSVSADQSAMRTLIRNERRHEFVAEHKRYFDILRWKTAEIVLNQPAYGINVNVADPVGAYNVPQIKAQDRAFDASRMYVWPIPQSVIDANPMIKQNPGW